MTRASLPPLRIEVSNRQRFIPIPPAFPRRLEEAFSRRLGGRRVSLVFVSDEPLRRLHEAFLGDVRATDVMAFPLRSGKAEPCGEGFDGEVIVSAERALAEARRRRIPPSREMVRYAIHGLLHLAGMDDHASAGRRAMRSAERRILAALAGYTGFPERGVE
ncbi:MAG: rRNA maturation RNase YbeY [Planctomycetota bacterium]